MQKTIEIKAMSKDAAIQRALKILEATSEDVVSVVEKEKSRSFLGLFNKEGVYLITIDKDRVVETQKVEKKVDEKSINNEKKQVKEKSEIKEVKVEKPIKKEYVKVEKKEEKHLEEVKVRTTKVERTPKNDIILEKTKMLLECMSLNLNAEITFAEGRYYTVNLFGEDNGIIIGKKGKTLNSFEYLLNSIIKECRIEVDVEGFKEKRNDTLRELAKKMAEKALVSNKTIRLNPMPPRERKVIHEIINKYPELDTFSEGKDPKRYIVIKRKK